MTENCSGDNNEVDDVNLSVVEAQAKEDNDDEGDVGMSVIEKLEDGTIVLHPDRDPRNSNWIQTVRKERLKKQGYTHDPINGRKI